MTVEKQAAARWAMVPTSCLQEPILEPLSPVYSHQLLAGRKNEALKEGWTKARKTNIVAVALR